MILQEGGYALFVSGVDGKVEDKLCSEPKKLVGFGLNMRFCCLECTELRLVTDLGAFTFLSSQWSYFMAFRICFLCDK